MTEEKQFNKERWTYLGRRFQKGQGKIVHRFLGENGKESEWAKSPAGRGKGVVGGVYEVEVAREDDTMWRRGGFDYTGVCDDPRRPEWSARDQEAALRHSQHQNHKALARVVPYLDSESIAPLRRAYWKGSGSGRSMVLATVMEAIMKRPTAEEQDEWRWFQ